MPDPLVIPHHVLVRPVASLISSGTETANIHTDSLMKEVAENPSHVRKIWDAVKSQGPMRTFSEVKAKFSEYGVLGYSGAGVIVGKHQTVRDFEIGDRVAYGGEGTGHAETILTGEKLVVKIPDAVPFEQACFTTLGSIAINSVRIAQISVGDVVAVIGVGLVGQLVAQIIKAQGGVVVAIDINRDRVELARSMQVDHALNGGSSVLSDIQALTDGRGVDCVIVAAAAKSAAPFQLAVNICRDRGRIVVLGAVPLELPRDEMYMKELQLLMSRAYGPGSYDPVYEKHGHDYPLPYVRWTENRNMSEFLRLLGKRIVNVEPLITHRFTLEDAANAYQTIMNPAENTLAVILSYPNVTAPTVSHTLKVNGRAKAKKSGTLGLALIGAANLARWHHLPNLKKIPAVELKAIHSASGARGKTFAERFGADYATTSYDDILSDSNIDIVLIVTRHQYHFEQALRAVQAGKHVFLEKPMALTHEECRQLFKAVMEAETQFTVGFNRRFAPFYAEMKRVVAQRTGPAVVNCRMNSPGISGSYWGADPAIGGALVGEGCHFVDLMYWLLESEPISVSAYSLPTGRKDPIGENNLVASFRYADGSIGNLTYCTIGSKGGGEHVELFAPGVTAESRNFKELSINGGSAKISLRPEKGYRAQMSAFIRDIQTGCRPEVTVLDGSRATIGCLAMLESAQTQEPLTINLAEVLNASGNA